MNEQLMHLAVTMTYVVLLLMVVLVLVEMVLVTLRKVKLRDAMVLYLGTVGMILACAVVMSVAGDYSQEVRALGGQLRVMSFWILCAAGGGVVGLVLSEVGSWLWRKLRQ